MIREGKVFLELDLPKVISADMGVFYNPHMRENRDISLLMLLVGVPEGAVVCDPMGASGVRALRFLLETQKVGKVIYNDINPKAVDFFIKLLEKHSVDKQRVEVYNEDAVLLLRRLKNCHYVDLDPFGSPIPFLESFLFPVARHGILAVSATDTAVLSGTYPQTCQRRYHAKPLLECEFYHEVGIRILIKKVVEEGAKHDYAFEPIFSYSYRHYLRVFFRKDIGPRRADRLMESIGYLLYCDGCLFRKGVRLEDIQRTCPYCSNRLLVAGPLWLGSLWNKELVERLWEVRGSVEISEETNKLLKRIKGEAHIKSVGFYTLSSIAKAFRLSQPPPMKRFLEVFEGKRTHFDPEGFRTELDHEEFLRRVKEL
ncbi:MAG: tRNA (guanine(10)-N(2))-dimethyltransferase [Aquificota bacterium]|nr:MAG: tRNA (guanine(10)-N(2))-dimethyltransferase [Aquificota bacterium]